MSKGVTAAVLVSLLFCFTRPGERFIINTSPSVSRGLYYISKRPAAAGDYVLIESRFAAFNEGLPPRLVKIAAYAGGEHISIDGERLAVNGSALVKKYMPAGVRYNGVLGPGECIILGSHERSFDSRYFGPVPLAACTRLVPVLLINENN